MTTDFISFEFGICLNMIFNMVQQGAVGNIVDIEDKNGDTIQLFVE